MNLTKTFTGVVHLRLHKNPPIYHISSDELGNIELDLADLNLSDKEIDALEACHKVEGEYVETTDSGYKIMALKPA